MNMPLKSDLVTSAAPTIATAASEPVVVELPSRPFAFRTKLAAGTSAVLARVIPPVIVIAVLLAVWELLCRKAGATLPPPSRVFRDTKELIFDPFFDRGGIDKGLFWHLSASLQQVAIGYAMAAVVGVALGTLVGQSMWAMRGLDPVFQVLRTVPPLAWLPLSLAAFRQGHPAAIFVIFITAIWPIIINTAVGIRNIPQDYRNVAAVLQLNPFEFFREDHGAIGGAIHFHRPAHRHWPVVAGDNCRRDVDRRCWHRFLHLGRMEFVPRLRNHPGPDLCRSGRLRSRQDRCGRSVNRDARYRGQLKERFLIPYRKIDHVAKTFKRGNIESNVLKDITLDVAKGEYVSIIGHSGCGNSTLLNIVLGSCRRARAAYCSKAGKSTSRAPIAPSYFRTTACCPG